MSDAEKSARRYHWLGETVDDFVCEPHHAINDLAAPADATPPRPNEQLLLNMVASEADRNRDASVDLIGWNPDKLIDEVRKRTEGPTLFMPEHHEVLPENVNIDRLDKVIRAAHEPQPTASAALVGARRVGPATVRALSLLAELIYDAPASHRDPAGSAGASAGAAVAQKLPPVLKDRQWADYSYAHGGKDGTPHPVDRGTYDTSIEVLTDAVRKARLGNSEKTDALKRLARFTPSPLVGER
jgi:hypothetical protein